MEIEKLELKFEELISALDNTKTQETLKESNYNIEELNKIINNYLENMQSIELKDRNTLESKISQMFELCKRGLEIYNLNEFITLANFIKNKAPKKIEKIEDKRIEISEEEFAKRYDKLIEALNFEGEECNLILETPSKEQKPFKIFKNKNKSLAIYAKSSEKPMIIASDRLFEVAFNRKEPTYKSYEPVIISKIIDNSIFDFLQNDFLSKNLVDAIKSKLERTEDELIIIKNNLEKMQLENQTIEEKKEQFNEIFEKAENLDNKIKAVEDKAKLNASVSYWKAKQKSHKTKFWLFSAGAIGLIVSLVVILFMALNYHENQTNINKQIEIINDINTTTKVQEISNNNNKLVEKSSLFDFEYSKLAWYILMIFASSSAFWIIRITVKIALSNLHLSEDANERVVMIQTYLSFVNEGQIDENDKNLILSSLFRPSNIGIIKDESSVTVTDIITAFKK